MQIIIEHLTLLADVLQIGMPDVEEVIDAELNYKFATSGYDIRKFVGAALEGLKLEGMDALPAELLGAVDEAEKQSGRALDAENEQGWQVGGRECWLGDGGRRV